MIPLSPDTAEAPISQGLHLNEQLGAGISLGMLKGELPGINLQARLLLIYQEFLHHVVDKNPIGSIDTSMSKTGIGGLFLSEFKCI